MVASPKIFESDDSTPAAAWAPTVGKGETSATQTKHVWNDIGGVLGSDTLTGAHIHVKAWDGAKWVSSGVPCLDERWIRARIVGYDATGDADFAPANTGTKPLGTAATLRIPDIPANCAVYVEFYLVTPGDASDDTVQLRFAVRWNQNTVALAQGVGLVSGGGVLPGYRDASVRRLVEGFEITTSGTDSIDVAAGIYDFDGLRQACLGETLTLNQNDSAASALVAGESYVARISIGEGDAAPTATKGVKSATTPTAPALPADHINIRTVTVVFDAGGTSVIDDNDLGPEPLYGDFVVRDGGGLTVTIGIGEGMSVTDHLQWHDANTSVPVDASDTSYLWMHPDGNPSATLTDEPPVLGAYLLAEVVTGVAEITSITDSRTYVDTDFVVRLEKHGDLTAAEVGFAIAELEHDADLLEVIAGVGTNGTTSAGSFIFDVHTLAEGASVDGAGTTIFTSQGTDDQRPTIAYNAASLRDATKYHEVRRFAAGTRFRADLDAVPTKTVDPKHCYVLLHFRRYR